MSTPPLPSDLPDDALHRVTNRLHSLAIRALRHARVADEESGLSPQRLSLLSVLVYAGSRTVGELAALEQVSAPAVSRIATALERAGLLSRERDAADRRVVRLAATDRGRALLEEARRRRLERLAALLASLAPERLAAIEAVLDEVAAAAARGGEG